MQWLTLRQLRSDNWEARRTALLKLGASRDRTLLPTIIGSLADLQPEVREAAAAALDELDPRWRDADETRQAVRGYVDALEASSVTAAAAALAAVGRPAADHLLESFDRLGEAVQATAVDLFGQIGDRRALDYLLERFDTLRPAVQMKAIRLFGQMRETRAVGRLIEALRYQPSGEPVTFPTCAAGSPHRRCAAFALGKIKDKAALEALTVARTDPEHGVREAAAEALELVDPQWRVSDAVRRALPIAMARMALDETQDPRAPREARLFVMERLGEHPARGFAFHDEYRRFVATGALAAHPAAREAVPLLVQAIDTRSSGWDKAEAARLLGRIGDPAAIEPLYQAVAESRPCRSAAAEALLTLGAEDRLAALLGQEEIRTLKEKAAAT